MQLSRSSSISPSLSPSLSSAYFTLVLALSASAPACGSAETGDYHLVLDRAPAPTSKLDLLFLVDNSGGTESGQAELVNSAKEHLFDVIERELGQPPDLHIGVISPDLGAGDNPGTGCSLTGDDGQLRAWSNCDLAGAPFLIDVADPANPSGPRQRNYPGTFEDAFRCVAQLGPNGCGFEQVLGAVVRALEPGVNDGFLRQDALLAVIVHTDEDDCTAIDDRLYSDDESDPELGPLASFRCFEHGVVCAEPDPRAPGLRTECTAAATAYMSDVQPYIDAVKAVKRDPSMVVVAGIIGDVEPLEVQPDIDSGIPRLRESCTSSRGAATPGVRIAEFLAGFPGRALQESICAEDMSSPLQRLGRLIGGTAAGSTCLVGAVTDIGDFDSATDGIQPRCRAFEITDVGTPDEQMTRVRACQSPSDIDCFDIARDGEQCALTGTQLAAKLPARAAHFRVECRRPAP